GGEFGRTVFGQGDINNKKQHGRDHHGRCFTIWMAGGGIKPGTSYGETDDFCYNVAKDPVHVHDFQATLLHLLGIDHTKLTFRFQGRDFRLTDVFGTVVKRVLPLPPSWGRKVSHQILMNLVCRAGVADRGGGEFDRDDVTPWR